MTLRHAAGRRGAHYAGSMMRFGLASLLILSCLSGCADDAAPERRALTIAGDLVARAGIGDGAILAPIMGVDSEGRLGLCGVVETRKGPVRIVADFAAGTVRSGRPASQQRISPDLGERRFCTAYATERWQRLSANDPIGLAARLPNQLPE
ncbi:hypothetical protein [Sandarakinorhabdus sp.]|uniref:hypothetical protein n=1 Tax=Sandarakinorhabdus sp. TaxID=1916663 RepID=UPI00286DF06B|nr:hypothetical protein [Sandarakinorhabdus sp.]